MSCLRGYRKEETTLSLREVVLRNTFVISPDGFAIILEWINFKVIYFQ